MSKAASKAAAANESSSFREAINELAQELIKELREEKLTPMEKLSFLKAILPYAVGKLPNAAINYDYCSGQPTSARIIEPTPDGGSRDWADNYLWK